MKEEALKLADEIEDSGKLMIHVRVTGGEDIVKAADMIRKLVAELDKPRELSDEEIKEIADSVCHKWKKNGIGEMYMEDFARAILKKASEK